MYHKIKFLFNVLVNCKSSRIKDSVHTYLHISTDAIYQPQSDCVLVGCTNQWDWDSNTGTQGLTQVITTKKTVNDVVNLTYLRIILTSTLMLKHV